MLEHAGNVADANPSIKIKWHLKSEELLLAVRIRLQRHGRKRNAFYRVVAADARSQRDGAFLEALGYYDPMTEPANIKIDAEKALKWLKTGAQPSDTAKSLLTKVGVWEQFVNPDVSYKAESTDEMELSEEE